MKITGFLIERNVHRLGHLGYVDMSQPADKLLGWKLSLRGPAVYLVSPPGWAPNKLRAHERDPKGPHLVIEVPRTDVVLYWEGDASVDALAKYDSPPMERAK